MCVPMTLQTGPSCSLADKKSVSSVELWCVHCPVRRPTGLHDVSFEPIHLRSDVPEFLIFARACLASATAILLSRIVRLSPLARLWTVRKVLQNFPITGQRSWNYPALPRSFFPLPRCGRHSSTTIHASSKPNHPASSLMSTVNR